MKTRNTLAGILAATLAVALVSAASAADQAKPKTFGGIVFEAYDADAGVLTAKKGSKTFTFQVPKNSRGMAKIRLKPADLEAGRKVRIYGKIDKDKGVIAGETLVVQDKQDRAAHGIAGTAAVGTLERDGDALSLKVNDKVFKVTQDEKFGCFENMFVGPEAIEMGKRGGVSATEKDGEWVLTDFFVVTDKRPESK